MISRNFKGQSKWKSDLFHFLHRMRNPIRARTVWVFPILTVCNQSYSYHVQLAHNPHTTTTTTNCYSISQCVHFHKANLIQMHLSLSSLQILFSIGVINIHAPFTTYKYWNLLKQMEFTLSVLNSVFFFNLISCILFPIVGHFMSHMPNNVRCRTANFTISTMKEKKLDSAELRIK